MIINKDRAPHYNWGKQADGWHLLNNQSLSVIEERLPANTGETAHLHKNAQQFFYILSGTATFTVQGETHVANASDSIHIKANQIHKIENMHNEECRFLVVSQPHSHGDRIEVTQD